MAGDAPREDRDARPVGRVGYLVAGQLDLAEKCSGREKLRSIECI